MKRVCLLVLMAWGSALAEDGTARNVILFLGDAAGIPTLHAASLYAYNEPRRLFIHRMPYIALMETSTASSWVTDSAAGMTAIVTGRKTHNGVISQDETAVRGKKDGRPLKTILEYAEERGLSTGVVTNSSAASATPAACYAHVNDRRKEGEIFARLLKPPFGDGVDVVIGAGRSRIFQEMRAFVPDPERALMQKGYAVTDSLERAPPAARRLIVLLDSGEFDLGAAALRAIDILSRNPKGYFLMVESDLHTDDIVRGLERTVEFDRIIERISKRVRLEETLILFTADHSYDLRVNGGRRGEPLIRDAERDQRTSGQESITWQNLRREDEHTGEEVLVAAQGPGAGRIRGVLSNTDLFRIMLAAFGWKETSPKER
ncbi:MAG: alkaline phosphatase [Bryobacterales bacterium]|nr:alkaline phosphatase [Bryobacteraceae bacterium]MDW8353682.1 alkaline phosphatase [Bryobacterales bacterium]